MRNTTRGFIVSAIENKSHLEQVLQGDFSAVQLIPVLAENEEEALNAVRNAHQEPINITSLEALETQVKLILDFADTNNILLTRNKDLFN